MKQLLLRTKACLLLLLLMGAVQGLHAADFKDFSVDLRDANGGIITSDEAGSSTTITFGLSVATDATVSRVAADAAGAVAVITGLTGNNHGLQSFSASVPVAGAVQITMSTCSWGGDVTVKDATGQTVATFTTKKGEGGSGCYKGNGLKDENIISAKYVGDATTLTISGGGYVGFFAVEAISASSVSVAYSLGDVQCQGSIVPTGGTFAAGDEYTIPSKNFTLYKEGYTLTGWTDGESTYDAGAKITLSKDLALTPVFTQNAVSLADRTEEVTLKWDFQRQNGAPTVGYQNQTGLWVTQAVVGGKTIDVKADFDTNNGGKFANAGWPDWAQLNSGTKWTIPSCKGATVSIYSYSATTTTTIDGQTDYTTSGNTVSYTIQNTADNIDIVIGDGSYFRYIQAVLPVVASAGGQSYDNEAVSIEWPMLEDGNVSLDTKTVLPKAVISQAAFDYTPTGATVATGSRSKDPENGMKFVTFTGENVQTHWMVKPAKGLTFTPTQIKLYVQRFGTNKKDGVVVTAKAGDNGTITTLGTFTARRANWDDSQEEKQWGSALSNLVNEVVIDLTADQQKALASGDGFHLYATTGLASDKAGGFADCRIYGKVSGTAVNVNTYTLSTTCDADAGTVTKYPNADEYEEGNEVTLTATPNFGYKFLRWVDDNNTVVSTDAKFKYTVTADATLTALFRTVKTYELKLTVDGTNDYMVTVSPAPTVVDGKWMYEDGTTVELTANQYDGLVTFTNWSDGVTSSVKPISMTEDVQITASYAQADIIAGWDFYKAGGNGRKADFAAADNDADALSLVNTADGTTSGWLDKSTLGGGGYESFKGAAVNWRQGSGNGDVGNWHWQTKVNAEAFTDINVQFQMLYNYNAYQTYNAEYSLNGTDWTEFGSLFMNGNRVVGLFKETMPAACNNQKDLYIRLIADKTSQVDGASSANDGNTLAMFFITGTPKLVDDGKAPVLETTVPADKATGVSATGKVVLTFDEKVQLAVTHLPTATLGSLTLNPTVSGKTVTFEYKGLDYATPYTFTLPANSISDLTGNFVTDAITISFTTMSRPSVTKGLYDAVVSTADELVAAISAAEARSDKNVRFRIFVKNGEYTIPLSSTMKTCNGYEVPECITFIKSGNISLIGESRDGVIITNGIDKNETFAGQYGTTSKYDGIGNSDVLQISGSDYYFQDLTIESGMDDATGRDLAIQDKATRTIYKNTGLRGYQDTWTSNKDNGLYYFEGGYLRGRTDYMCGKGDAFFNGVELRQIYGGYAAVPSKPAKIGWVYKDCIINGEAGVAGGTNYAASAVDGTYTLGRPWGSGTPVAVFIDTKMNVVPSAIGWNEMSGGYPARFAEYNSMTKTGSVVDLSGRKKTFGDGHANNPVLTAEEALEYSDMSKMFGEWQPTLLTEQAPVPQNVKQEAGKLTWDNSNYVLLWAVVKDGKVIDFTTEPSYALAESGEYAVRAANEMGGLSEASQAVSVTLTTVKVKMNASGYASLASKSALDFSAVNGLKAYIAESKSDTEVSLVSVDEAPAGTGLILKGTASTEYDIPVIASAAAISNNLLVGCPDGAALTAAQTVYVLTGNQFMLFGGTEIPAGKAYLPKTGDARVLVLTFGDATAIDELSGSADGEEAVYNLNGQRVDNPEKGVYIVNGKKVIIK